MHRIQCGIQYSLQVHWFGTVIVAFFIFFSFTLFSSINSKFSKIHLVSVQQKVKVSLVFMREYRNAALVPGGSKGTRVKPPRGQHCPLLPGATCLLNWACFRAPGQGFSCRTVCSGAGCAVSGILMNKVNGTEVKLALPVSFSTSSIASLTTPQAHDIYVMCVC